MKQKRVAWPLLECDGLEKPFWGDKNLRGKENTDFWGGKANGKGQYQTGRERTAGKGKEPKQEGKTRS